MSAQRDAYRKWEQSGPFVHIMIIERGAGELENRLTLSDRLYVDKGVGGIKYHHTYPAPINCITSPLRISMGIDRCSYDDVVLSNEGGRFDQLYSEANSVGKPFRILRGHPGWSLLETRLPFMFLPIYVGIIESVNFRKKGGEVVLKISAARYRMDNTVGSVDAPLCLGDRFNVPASLVNASTLRYRFCANEARDGSFFELRDRGVVLTEPTDYTKVLEDGKFKTLVQLTSPPAGQVTARVVGGTVNLIQNPLTELGWLTTTFLHPNYSLLLTRQAMTVGEGGACANANRSKLYLRSFSNNRIAQFSMTGEDPTTLIYDSKMSTTINTSAFRLNQSGTKLWYYDGVSRLRTRTLSTPFDISTSTDDAALKDIGIPFTDIELAPDESAVWLCSATTIRKFVVVPGDASSAMEDANASIDLTRFIVGAVHRFTFIDDGFGLLVYDRTAAQIRLFRLFTAFGNEMVDTGRAYSSHEFAGNASIPVRGLIESSDRKSVFVLDSAPSVNKIDLSTDLRPNTIHRNTYDGFGFPYSAALFVNQETRIGTVIANFIAGLIDGYLVDRLGGLRFVKLTEPAFHGAALTSEPVFPLSFRDFVGTNDYLQIVDTMEKVDKVTINYSRNDQVQTPGDLATSLSVANVEKYGREWSSHSLASLVQAGLGDLVFDTCITEGFSVAANSILSLRREPRKVYQLTTNLRWVGMTEPFSVGSVLQVKDDWHFPSLEPDDYLIATAVDIDFTRNTMQLRAYK